MFEGAAILKISSNPSRSKSMATSGIGEGSSPGPALDHVEDVRSRQGISGELVALFEAANHWPLLVVADSGRLDPGIEIFVEAMMTGHLVPLATFFVESH